MTLSLFSLRTVITLIHVLLKLPSIPVTCSGWVGGGGWEGGCGWGRVCEGVMGGCGGGDGRGWVGVGGDGWGWEGMGGDGRDGRV